MPGVNLPKGFNTQEHNRRARKFANMLPTRENCDLDDPREMFLWMLVALPGLNGGQQAMPSSYNMLVSQHLHECGAMLQCSECGHSKLPEKAYVAPAVDDPHWMTSPGRWTEPGKVPVREGDPMGEAIGVLSKQQQAALAARMVSMYSPAQLRDLAAKKEAGEL